MSNSMDNKVNTKEEINEKSINDDDIDSSTNNEKEFKELESEIHNVIHGKDKKEEEKPEKNETIHNNLINYDEIHNNENEINNDEFNDNLIIDRQVNQTPQGNFRRLNKFTNTFLSPILPPQNKINTGNNNFSNFKAFQNNNNNYMNNINMNPQMQQQINFSNPNNNNLAMNSYYQNNNINTNQNFLINPNSLINNTNNQLFSQSMNVINSNINNNMNNQAQYGLTPIQYSRNLNIDNFVNNNSNNGNNSLFNMYNNLNNSNANINNIVLNNSNNMNNINNINNTLLLSSSNQLFRKYNLCNMNNDRPNPNITPNIISGNRKLILNNFININTNQNQRPIINNINNNVASSKIISRISLNNNFNNCSNNFINNNYTNKNINDETMINKIMNKRLKQKKKNKKDVKNDFNDNNNDNGNNFADSNSNNNLKFNKCKVFNPIPEGDKEKNIIVLDDILSGNDLRTSLMIKNIPNKYTITTFLEEINYNFKDTYDIFYLPIDYVNKCNLGFAFINFVEPFHIIRFYELYRGKKWKKFNSDKICELVYAKYQGKSKLIAHFEKGKVLSFDSEEKRPLILPTPNPLPNINLPYQYLNQLLSLYPNIKYNIQDNKDHSEYIITIKGNMSALINSKSS